MQKKVICIALAWAFSQSTQASESQEVNAQLAELQTQIQEMKQAYEARIAALEGRLQSVVATTGKERVADVSVPSATTSAANAFNPEVSLILQGAYKQRKRVPERQITGFWPAGDAHGDHDHGEEQRGFTLDHTELVLAANIDPNFRGQATLALLNDEVELEEAWFQTLGLGHGLSVKGGRFFSGIGYLNEQHPHQWDFYDQPLMYQALFGEHSYAQDGVQVKWVAPVTMFVGLGAELGRGQNFPGTDRNHNGGNSHTLFAKIGDDIGVSHSWQAGVSYLRTEAKDRTGHFESEMNGELDGAFSGRSRVWLADFVYKWAPNGNPQYQNFKFQAEYFRRKEDGSLAVANDAGDSFGDSHYGTRQSGYYLQGTYQFSPNWRAGVRYDRLSSGSQDLGSNPGEVEIASYRPKRSSAMVDYSWSEYSRVRLQYARDESMRGLTDNQVTLQYIMSLGSHGAHKF